MIKELLVIFLYDDATLRKRRWLWPPPRLPSPQNKMFLVPAAHYIDNNRPERKEEENEY